MPKIPLELGPRPRTRRALMTAVLIVQSALLMGATLLIDVWARTHIQLSTQSADQLFVFLLSIAFAILSLTGLVIFLISRRYKDELENTNEQLTDEVRSRLAEALSRRNALIHGLARLADYRDSDTGDHLDRIGRYARLLAIEMGRTNPTITDAWTERLVLASSLHDIGKVGIPDSILLKPGKLTDDERVVMQQHTVMGADTLISIRNRFGADPFIDMGINIAIAHHERWDGAGYPFGLKGTQISLAARIVALADVYDALTSERVYKAAFSHEKAQQIILEGRSSHFDPDVVDAFVAAQDAFNEIRAQSTPQTFTEREDATMRARRFLGALPKAA